ncbi:hypothetical protein D3C72_1917290 [compost metagenome]
MDSGAFDQFDGELKVRGSDGALIHFLFRLLGKLQSLGTVTAIDWSAYAKILDTQDESPTSATPEGGL